jgi:sugar/nucleoside kinase (ribokinase family)
MKKILTIGEILVEIIATERGNGFRSAVPLIGPFPSGAPAIFIDQVGKLGHDCAMISAVGDDDFGHVNLDRLRADGVDVSGIRIEASHLHVMGTSLYAPSVIETVLSAMRTIKAKGGTISFDPNLRPEILKSPGMREALQEVIAETDLFLPSGDELFLFTQAKSAKEAVEELLAQGIKVIVLKQGSAGATYHDAQRTLTLPSMPVEEVDPTGAGDCFGATFVTFWLEGATPEVALRYANAAGALAVTRIGPMEGASTRAELDALLAG